MTGDGETPDDRLRREAEATIAALRMGVERSLRGLGNATLAAAEHHAMLRELGLRSPWEQLAAEAETVCVLFLAIDATQRRGIQGWPEKLAATAAEAVESMSEALAGEGW